MLSDLEELVVLGRHVVDRLAAAPRVDDAVGDRDRVVAVAVRALVRPAELLPCHVDLHQRELEFWCLWLRSRDGVCLSP